MMVVIALIAKLQMITFIIMVISDSMDHNTGQFYPLKNKLIDYFSIVWWNKKYSCILCYISSHYIKLSAVNFILQN